MLIKTAPEAGRAVAPEAARQRLRQVLDEWRGKSKIAIFGAGAHTHKVLRVLEENADKIAGVTDDSPQTWGRRSGRWTVRAPKDLLANNVGAILVSSDVQQTTIEARLRREFKDRFAILTLYQSPETAADGPTLPHTGERQTGRTLEAIEIGHRVRYYWALQHLPAGASVLDAACGSGYGSCILAEGGLEVFGIDISREAVTFARHYFARGKITYAVAPIDDGASVARLTTYAAPFDAVISLETLEHLQHPDTFLATAFDSLKPGGILLCSTPNAEAMSLAEAPFHHRHFTLEETLQLLENTGFQPRQWFGQEGLQILKGRSTHSQRYHLHQAVKPG